MSYLWDRFKWLLTHGVWFIAGIILLIDPKHIDDIAAQHPKWAALILAVWAAILGWASKPRNMTHDEIVKAMRSPQGQGPNSPPPPPKKAA